MARHRPLLSEPQRPCLQHRQRPCSGRHLHRHRRPCSVRCRRRQVRQRCKQAAPSLVQPQRLLSWRRQAVAAASWEPRRRQRPRHRCSVEPPRLPAVPQPAAAFLPPPRHSRQQWRQQPPCLLELLRRSLQRLRQPPPPCLALVRQQHPQASSQTRQRHLPPHLPPSLAHLLPPRQQHPASLAHLLPPRRRQAVCSGKPAAGQRHPPRQGLACLGPQAAPASLAQRHHLQHLQLPPRPLRACLVPLRKVRQRAPR